MSEKLASSLSLKTKNSISTQVAYIETAISDLRKAIRENPFQDKFHLNISDFKRHDKEIFLERLSKEHIQAKVFWYSTENILEIHMPVLLHEVFEEWVPFVVGLLYVLITKYGDAVCQALAGEGMFDIESGGEYTLHLRNPAKLDSDIDTNLTEDAKEDLHWHAFNPDGSIKLFSKRSKQYVQSLLEIVFEAAFSQSLQSVLEKVWKYLYWEPYEIRMVVIYNMSAIGEEGRFKSEISVWQRAGDVIDSAVQHDCPGLTPSKAESDESNASDNSPTTASSGHTLVGSPEADWQAGSFKLCGHEEEIQASPPIIVVDERNPSHVATHITLNLFDILPYCQGLGDQYKDETVDIELGRLQEITKRRVDCMWQPAKPLKPLKPLKRRKSGKRHPPKRHRGVESSGNPT
ncbi:hypothetical protein CTheo_8061 [Ceratobasidium theobromae]|uniref:Uncharacterized protein n=1 Tax=Ceratobasidium theobromae TaxID=1582974 RepID=A0A5N5QAS9_9AGAM|nr:hypothetical protein CTheo_8061 [Ceratobasidium theobromae]